MRKVLAILSGLWLVFVLIMGIGRIWLTHNPDALAGGVIGVAGFDEVENTAVRQRREARREEVRTRQAEAAAYSSEGWGRETVIDHALGGEPDGLD